MPLTDPPGALDDLTVEQPHPAATRDVELDVTLVVDGKNYATATLNEAGNLTFTLKGLAGGNHTYKGVFAGNTAFVAAESPVKTLKVFTAEEVAAAQLKKEQEAAAAAQKELTPGTYS